jgi:hypothetical protein
MMRPINCTRPYGDRTSEVDCKMLINARASNTVVTDLQLRELGLNAKVILVRDEYRFTLDALVGRQNDSGGDNSNGS